MKHYLLLIAALVFQISNAQLPIRHIAEATYSYDEFMIGSSSGTPQVSTPSQVILDREYNYVTPTNEFKQTYIHPNPGSVYRWERCDDWVTSCKKNGQVIRMHSPISPQCSDYVQDDSRTAKELATIMAEYMTALCKRYNGVEEILWMDVVNETIDKDGTWFGPKPGVDKWENPWTQMGFDNSVALAPPIYIDSAFAIANLHAPDIKQMINQHGAFEEEVWEKMKELVAYLRNKGRRVDGLGWQAHIDLGWEKIPGNMARLSSIIDWCHSNSLAFHITEFNVWLREGNETKLNEQAETFGKIVELLRSKSVNGPTGVNFWQVSNVDSQHEDRNGSLFDSNHQPKAAYYAVKEAINLCDVTQGGNQILNPGFEDGVSAHWRVKTYGGAEATLSNSTEARTCNNSGLVNVNRVADDVNIGKAGIEITNPINVSAEQALATMAFIKGPEGSKARLQMVFTLNDDSKQYRTSEEITLNDSYQQIDAIFVAPANVKEFQLRVQCGGQLGKYFVDDVSIIDTITTSTQKTTLQNIKVFPNPAKGNVQIEGLLTNSFVSIFTMNGTNYFQQVNLTSNLNIDVSNWQKGCYFVHVSGSTNVYQEKLLIQ